MTGDTCHMTGDTCHMTDDTCHMIGGDLAHLFFLLLCLLAASCILDSIRLLLRLHELAVGLL